MITAKKPSSPSEILQSARHVLFVEGNDSDAIDPLVLRTLLEEKIRVEPLGPSYNIRSAAEGLFKYHPDYYFLIDRDHYDDEFVKKCWDNFPDPDKSNLLIWHRREIENYFLIPEYISHSTNLVVSQDQLKKEIIRFCTERLYIDAANQVLISIREDLKANWIKLFTNPFDFQTKESALIKLTEAKEFSLQKDKVIDTIEKDEICMRFNNSILEMTGGKDPIEFGSGKWLEMIRGKKVLPNIIKNCFQIKDAQGKSLQGKEKLNEIIKDLLKKPLKKQPEDFKKLHELISSRLKS